MAKAARKHFGRTQGEGDGIPETRSDVLGKGALATISRGSTYREATVHLDGNLYEGCIFVKCRLVYSGTGPVGLDGCRFEDCAFDFEGAASKAVEFLNALAGDPGLRGALQYILPDLRWRESIH